MVNLGTSAVDNGAEGNGNGNLVCAFGDNPVAAGDAKVNAVIALVEVGAATITLMLYVF